MIDFRYHVVSLISVFLALAVGIALGAGPLKESLGAQLTGQVEQLRIEKSELREELEAERDETNLQRAFMLAMTDELLGDLLVDRNIALLTTPGVEKQDTDGVLERIEQSGAKITARFEVSESWTSPSQRAFRSSLAGSLHDYLDPLPEDSASVEEQLALALGQMLTSHADDDALVLSENSLTLQELLVSADLISPSAAHTAPADLVLILVPSTGVAEDSAENEDLVFFNETISELAVSLEEMTEGVVVAGSAEETFDSLGVLRKDYAGQVTTVDGIDNLTGQITAVLALADSIQDPGNAFGSRVNADLVAPTRPDLPAPDRSLPLEDEEDADAEETANTAADELADDEIDSGANGEAENLDPEAEGEQD